MPSRLSWTAGAQIGGRRLVLGFLLLALTGGCRQSADGHLRKADDYAATSRLREAIIEYRSALQVDPKRADIRRKLATAYVRNHDAANALHEYVRVADLLPNDAAAQRQAGDSLLAAKAFEDAKDRADKALALEPGNPADHVLLGNALAGLKDIDAAMAAYEKAIALDPTEDSTYLAAISGLVNLDLAARRPAAAVSHIEAALKRAQPSGELYLVAAQTYAAANNAAKAEEMLKGAIEVEPSRLRAYGLLGQLYISQHRLDDARTQFQQIAEQNPSSTSANTMLGMLLEAQHRFPEAEQQYQKALALDARSAVAANNLAWLYVASNRNLDQALQLAQGAQQQLSDEPHVNDTLGWIYYRKHMAASALRYLEASVRADGSDPTTHYHLGMAYIEAGEVDKGKKELQRALAFNRDFGDIAAAREALSRLGS